MWRYGVIAPFAVLAGCADSQSSQHSTAVATASDPRGLPRMVQAAEGTAPSPEATAMLAARTHVERLADRWGVVPGTLPTLADVGEVAVRGGTIARMRQVIDGLPVWGRELRVLVRRDGTLATASGTLLGTTTPRVAAHFAHDEAGAIATAVTRTYGGRADARVERARAKRVWYPQRGRLVAAWVVDAYTSAPGTTHDDANRTIIAGDTGRVLEHYSLVADAFTYSVFADGNGAPLDGPIVDSTPHPSGVPAGYFPPYLPGPSRITVDSASRTGDPWLPPTAVETRGNNVDAYVDLVAPSGFSPGDFRATISAPGTFGHVYDTSLGPLSSTEQQMASVTSLFYVANWLHDFWYDAGFTEAAGNAQQLNFGRGGVEGDPLLAEAQDGATIGLRNNANMATPGDGMSPRMQVYLWSGRGDSSHEELDGSLDATLVAHEFGHYLHHRLSHCNTKMCAAMSEGWGDFTALLLLARAGDDLDGAFPVSVYATQSLSTDPAYFGLRRAPYSVDPDINSLSFRHMADGEPLPTNHPINARHTNSQVHNAGEVWAQALWEGYVALQRAGASFDDVRGKMAQYVVAGLLLAPPDASPIETRDAILAAALASSRADHDVLLAAFARRGFGSCAVAPAADSDSFGDLAESAIVAGKAIVTSSTLTDDCDDDGVLDAGETALLRIEVANGGHAPLTDVRMTVGSSMPGVSVMTPPVALATLDPLASTQLEIEVRLDGATTAIAGDLSLTIEAAGGCTSAVTVPVAFRLNIDDIAASATTDTFDAAMSTWEPWTSTWQHVRETPLDGAWHADNLAEPSDSYLTSPLLHASKTEPLEISFSHVHAFDVAYGQGWDGGVVEYSIDDGQTWQDVQTLTKTGYTGTIAADAGNALAGRSAYVATNPSWPEPDRATLALGTALAGKAFRIRFRLATDATNGAEGWTIDDVSFRGIVGTPFPFQVDDDGVCIGEATDEATAGGCCDAGPLRGATSVLALGVLAFVLRRRRRPLPRA